MARKYIFVGEKRSRRAIEIGVTWKDGALAAAQLFPALLAIGIDPRKQEFVNLFTDKGVLDVRVVALLRKSPMVIIGMGRIVQDELDRLAIEHIKLVHPAARGKIRKKERYAEHLKECMSRKKH